MISLPGCSDYITSIETPKLIKAEELQGGKVLTKNGKTLRYAGGFCIVFPYEQASGKKVAVRCWTAHVSDIQKRSEHISRYLQQSGLPYFVNFEYREQGVATSLGVFPIIIMDWIHATPLKNYLKANINNPSVIKSLADEFKKMTDDLHRLGFSHGDLQHGNIMVSPTGQLFLVDYDSMFVPGLENVADEIKGLASYQHPARTKLKSLSPKSDYFSELIIYTSLISLSKYPYLWEELNMEDSESLLFTQEDFLNPSGSKIFQKLKSDIELSDYVKAIELALTKSNIEDLLPLSEVITTKNNKIVSNLQEKWNKYLSYTSAEPIVDKENLKKKWSNAKTYEPEILIDVATIASKWKR